MHPRKMIFLGALLVVMGAILPFLMVMRILEPGFALIFLSHGASTAGLALGVVGVALYMGRSDY